MDSTEIEEIIGYSFQDKNLLKRALTHKALANEQRQKNQVWEDQTIFSTLGDAVLKLALTELLIESNCKTSGELTEKRIDLENEEKQVEIAQKLEIGQFIITNLREIKKNANKNPSVLEALLLNLEKWVTLGAEVIL
jgi:ribonuclease-3